MSSQITPLSETTLARASTNPIRLKIIKPRRNIISIIATHGCVAETNKEHVNVIIPDDFILVKLTISSIGSENISSKEYMSNVIKIINEEADNLIHTDFSEESIDKLYKDLKKFYRSFLDSNIKKKEKILKKNLFRDMVYEITGKHSNKKNSEEKQKIKEIKNHVDEIKKRTRQDIADLKSVYYNNPIHVRFEKGDDNTLLKKIIFRSLGDKIGNYYSIPEIQSTQPLVNGNVPELRDFFDFAIQTGHVKVVNDNSITSTQAIINYYAEMGYKRLLLIDYSCSNINESNKRSIRSYRRDKKSRKIFHGGSNKKTRKFN
jgi:hypothetical protein